MKQRSSIAPRFLFVTAFLLLALTATAQFKKPLVSPRDRVQSSDAKWNIGILGGGNLSTWLHFQSFEASDWYLKNYKIFNDIPQSLGYFGGIGVERMIKSDLSVGLNVIYAQHNIKLNFVNDHYPIGWNAATDSLIFGRIEKGFKADYRTIEAYVPVTYYIGLSNKKNVVPYAYIAPRFSYIFPDTTAVMTHSSAYYSDNDSITSLSVPFNQSTYRKFNVGATIGVGSLFRINTSNYYLLFKLDVSANMNAIPTFKKGEVANNEFNHLRYSADAHATLTFMLPLKKQLQGACVKWGKYD